MWSFFRSAPKREIPKPAIPKIEMPATVSVPRQNETLAAQVELAEARVSHLVTAEDIRQKQSEHASLVDDVLAVFERPRHARH